MGGTRLLDRVRGAQGKIGGPGGPKGGAFIPSEGGDFNKIKADLQQEIIESLDFEQVGQTSRDDLAAKLRQGLAERVEARQLPLNRMERERLVEEILDN